jgi:hypothetical protein
LVALIFIWAGTIGACYPAIRIVEAVEIEHDDWKVSVGARVRRCKGGGVEMSVFESGAGYCKGGIIRAGVGSVGIREEVG